MDMDPNLRNSRRVSGFFPDSPERTDSEPSKSKCEANCDRQTAKSRLSGVVFAVFLYRCRGKAHSHDQENNAHNLKPELVEDTPEGSTCGGSRLGRSLQGTAALGLLPGNARRYP
jgi:hypothetical protein